MEQRVVKHEKRLVAPVVPFVVYINVDLVAVDRVQIIEHAESQP